MEKETWRTIAIIAIIFVILFLLENAYFAYVIYSTEQDNKNSLKCYYEVCEEYPEALYDGGVCNCYDYDILGQLNLAKTKLID